MICTRKQLLEKLNLYKSDEVLYVLWWDKLEYEYETDDGRAIETTNEEFARALESIDTEPHEKRISDDIHDAIQEIHDRKV